MLFLFILNLCIFVNMSVWSTALCHQSPHSNLKSSKSLVAAPLLVIDVYLLPLGTTMYLTSDPYQQPVETS